MTQTLTYPPPDGRACIAEIIATHGYDAAARCMVIFPLFDVVRCEKLDVRLRVPVAATRQIEWRASDSGNAAVQLSF